MRMLWVLLTTCLAIARAAPPGDPDSSPNLLRLPPSMINDTIREKILKSCDDPILDTINESPETVWDELGCYYLHGALDWSWYSNQSQTPYSYVEYVSDKMHGPENMRCYQIDNDACNSPTVQCHDTDFACGYLLLNSFSNIHKMYHRGYETVQLAHDRIQDDIPTFVDIFAPELEVFDALGDLLIPLITLGLFGIGSFAKIGLDTIKDNIEDAAKKAKWEKRFPHIENGIALSAGMAMPYGLIHLPEKASGDATDALVFSILGTVYDHFLGMQMNHTRDLFSGSTQSLQALWRMVDRGAFIRYDGGKADLGEYHNEVRKMFFAALIPKVWEVAPQFRDGKEKKFSTPFFMATGKDCGSEWDYRLSAYGDQEDFPEICYEGKQWHIMVVRLRRDSGYFDHSRIQSWKPGVLSVPGINELTSEKGYMGVRAVDMLASAYGGYKKGGEKQFWAPDQSEFSKIITSDGSKYTIHYTEGVRGPGLVQMQVCPDPEKTLDSIYNSAFDPGLADNREWPCGI